MATSPEYRAFPEDRFAAFGPTDCEGRGMKRFTHRHRNNRGPVALPCYERPEDVLEDPEDDLAARARKAVDAARAAKRTKERRG